MLSAISAAKDEKFYKIFQHLYRTNIYLPHFQTFKKRLRRKFWLRWETKLCGRIKDEVARNEKYRWREGDKICLALLCMESVSRQLPPPPSVASKTFLAFVMEYVLCPWVRNLVAYKTIIIPPLPRRTIEWRNVKYIKDKKIVGIAGDFYPTPVTSLRRLFEALFNSVLKQQEGILTW